MISVLTYDAVFKTEDDGELAAGAEMGPDRRAKQDHPIGQGESRSPAGVYKNTNFSDLRQLLGIFCFCRFAGLSQAVALAVAFQDVAAVR